MALSIRNPEAERLAREISRRTGETLTGAIITALEERLRRLEGRTAPRRLADELNEIALHCASLPRLDDRSEDEILGYNELGIPD